jgi:type I restriction enzyme S subunit
LPPIPDRWTRCSLGDVVEIVRGVSYEKADARNTPAAGFVPILRANNIGEKLNFDDLVYVPESRVSDEQRLRVGDIVVAGSSGSRSVVGKAAPLLAAWCGAFGAFCMVVRPAERVNPRYVAYFMATREYRTRVSLLAAGVIFNNLKRQHVADTPIPLAPKSEQDRIVAEIEKQFTRLDAGVAALERLRAHLRRYRAAVLKAACEGKLVPTGAALAQTRGRSYSGADAFLEEIASARSRLATKRAEAKSSQDDAVALAALPGGWKWTTLGQLVWDSGYGTSEKCDYDAAGEPVLRIPNISMGGIDLDDLKRARKPLGVDDREALRRGDLLIVRTNGSKDLIGRGAVIFADMPRLTYFASYLIRFRLVDVGPLASYIALLWNGPWVRRWIESHASNSAGQYNVNLRSLAELPIPLPPPAEATRIIEQADKTLTVLDALEQSVDTILARAGRLRASILRAAFDGSLVAAEQPARAPAA